jgi:hypothetical protein
MFKHHKTTMVAITLLMATLAFGYCSKDKQPVVIVNPSSLALHKDETKNIFVTFQNITAYHFAIEDTLIAKFVVNSSQSSTLPASGNDAVQIIGCQVGNTNLLFLCPDEGIEKNIPIEVVE